MLDWLNDVAAWFAQFVPDWDLCEPTEAGVKFKPGGKIALLKPGHLYFWWPAASCVRTIDTKRQALTFGQRLTTKDDVSVQLNTVIVFTIDDAYKALVDTRDFEETIGEVAEKLTVKPIMSRDFKKICEDMADTNEIRNEITRGAKRLLPDYGVCVLDGYVKDFTKTTVFSHDGGGLVMGHEEEEE